MSNSPTTIVGNLGRDPELRFTNSGMAVCNLSVAVTHKPKNGDEETSWLDVTCFGEMAENVASLEKGTRVMACGRLKVRTYDKKDGSQGWAVEVIADEVGPSLRWATATVQRGEKGTKSAGTVTHKPSEEPF